MTLLLEKWESLSFGFDADAYVDGMDCGYMDIHNLIARGQEGAAHPESM